MLEIRTQNVHEMVKMKTEIARQEDQALRLSTSNSHQGESEDLEKSLKMNE